MSGLYVTVPLLSLIIALLSLAAFRQRQADKAETAEPKSNVVPLYPTHTLLRIVRENERGAS